MRRRVIMVAALALVLVGCGAWLLWPRRYERLDTTTIRLRVGQVRTVYLGVEQPVPYQHQLSAVEGDSATARIVSQGLSPLELLLSKRAPGSVTGEVGLRIEGRATGTTTVTTSHCHVTGCVSLSERTAWTVVVLA